MRIVSRLPFGSHGMDLPVITLAAPAAGPTVVVTANIHGDECTGIGAILELLPLLEAGLRRGTVHLYPSLNPEGLERRSRKAPEDDQDLNRLFPGDPRGSPSERQAALIWADLSARRPALLIDLHTDAPDAIPYALVDRATALRGTDRSHLEAQCRRLADASGLTVLQEYPDAYYTRFRLDRSLTGATLNRLRTPAITLECGPRLYLESGATATMRAALLGVLHAVDLVAEAPPPHPSRISGAWRRDAGPRASVAGILLPRSRPGLMLRRGEAVAELRSLTGEKQEELVADANGFVVSYAERSHVVAGVPVCTFGFEE